MSKSQTEREQKQIHDSKESALLFYYTVDFRTVFRRLKPPH